MCAKDVAVHLECGEAEKAEKAEKAAAAERCSVGSQLALAGLFCASGGAYRHHLPWMRNALSNLPTS